MTTTLLSAESIATVAAGIVGADLNLAATIRRDLAADFQSGQGRTVTIPVPGFVKPSVVSLDNVSAIPVASLTEQGIPVTLTDHVVSRIALTEGQLNLDLRNFTTQVVGPQADAIAAKVEASVAAEFESTPAITGVTYDPTNPAKALGQLRRQLRTNGVKGDATINLAIGSDLWADLLDSGNGNAPAFDANGNVRGMSAFESTRIAPDEAIAYIADAFVLVCRAPAVPNSATGASVSVKDDEGRPVFALRAIQGYDDSTANEYSLVSTMLKVQSIPLAVANEATGTVDLVEHGGAVRLSTSA